MKLRRMYIVYYLNAIQCLGILSARYNTIVRTLKLFDFIVLQKLYISIYEYSNYIIIYCYNSGSLHVRTLLSRKCAPLIRFFLNNLAIYIIFLSIRCQFFPLILLLLLLNNVWKNVCKK